MLTSERPIHKIVLPFALSGTPFSQCWCDMYVDPTLEHTHDFHNWHFLTETQLWQLSGEVANDMLKVKMIERIPIPHVVVKQVWVLAGVL